MRQRDGWKQFYTSLHEIPEWLKKPVPFVVEAVPLLQAYEVTTILDVGCGMGRHCMYFARMGFNVTGIDTSRRAVLTATRWSKQEELRNTTLLQATMTHLPFRARCFQAALGVSVLHHALKHEIEQAVAEIHRVLAEDGLLIANLLSPEDYRYGFGQEVEEGTYRVWEDFTEHRFEEVHHFFTQDELHHLLSNFQETTVEPISSGVEERLHCYWKVIARK